MKEKVNDKKWILYVTIPLTIMVFFICMTWIYQINNPMTIRMEMDENTLEAVRIAYIPLPCDDSIVYYVKENNTLKQIDCTNGNIINVDG